MEARSQTTTILFTDLVSSTELLQRTGDEQAERIFKAHHRLLSSAVQEHGGHEVKWLGDGLMVAFDSTLDAVLCAIEMQQASARPTAGERLAIRAGLNVGDAFIEESDFFGTSVVVARRLCDRAGAGQIFATDIVVRLLGDRGAAISTQDLGMLDLKGIAAPVPSVEVLYERSPLAIVRRLPFVGRKAEFDALAARFAEAHHSHHGSVVLVAGEPGIGKTRLAEEFCEQFADSAVVIRGNCYEGDVAAPFAPWTEALSALVEQTADDALVEALGAGAPDIATILPDIRRRVPGVEEFVHADPESERARLFASIGSFIRNAAQDRTLVVFLDDLQWSDKPSLALLEHVARSLGDRRIVIIGTYRDVEIDRAHPLAQTLGALRRMENHERIAIRGIADESVLELLTTIEPSDAVADDRSALAAALSRESAGNPFFINEVLSHLVETGQINHTDTAWMVTGDLIAKLGIPEGIKEVIGRRLSRLSDDCNRLLQRACAMTNGFTWDEIRAICDEPEEVLLDALDEALAARLIVERKSGVYAFLHALVRATLYEEQSTPRRMLLHRQVAEALERLYKDDVDLHVAELAAHYVASAGGDAGKAIDYSIRAGDRARELLAWEDASAHYQRALDAMEISKAPRDAARARLLLDAAECNRLCGQDSGTAALVHEAIDIARDTADARLFARAVRAFELGAQQAETDVTAERMALFDEALQMLEGEESVERVIVLARRVEAASAYANARAGVTSAGYLAWAGAKDDDILAQAKEAVALAERLRENYAIAVACAFLHNYAASPDNDLEQLELADRGIAAARASHSARMELDLTVMRAADLLALGRIDEFRDNAAHFRAVLDSLRYRPLEYMAAAMQVTLEVAEGHLGLAEQHLNDYLAKAGNNVTVLVMFTAQQYSLFSAQGRLGDLVPLWQGLGQRWPGIPVFPAGLCLARARAGQADVVYAELGRLVANLAGVPRDFLWKPTCVLLATACADVGHRPTAEVLYNTLLPYAQDLTVVVQSYVMGCVAHHLGRLATVLERWDEAGDHFENALASHQRMGFTAWLAATQLAYARMLLRRGAPPDARRAHDLLEIARRAHDLL
ncbi:MAG TPA: AAA family ATPase, partial [Tepidiformaceae bacterium]|nr:AAA family ATPase [Tepidiformaceae bacterium]